MAAGAFGDVRSRRVPCERGGGGGARHRAATAPDGTSIAQDQGIVAVTLTESLVRTDTRFVDGKPKRRPVGSHSAGNPMARSDARARADEERTSGLKQSCLCSVLSRCPENEDGARQMKLGTLTSVRLSQRRRLR